jgi:DnaJ-class molecular chaperone
VGKKKPKKKPVFEIEGFVSRTHTRCPDCEYRGDLDAVGKVYHERWARVSKCDECSGRGEISLAGVERIDPMARKTKK